MTLAKRKFSLMTFNDFFGLRGFKTNNVEFSFLFTIALIIQ